MERSSSLGKYSGGARPQAATSGRPSSGVIVAGRTVYPFDRGFCFIPQGEWTRGMERRPGAPFHVTHWREAIIIPAGDSYPHLTLDTQEIFQAKISPPCMKVRVSSAHFSPGQSGRCLTFQFRGVELVPNGWFDRGVLASVQHYLARTRLPFRLPESLLAEQQPEAAPVTRPPVTAVEDIEPQASTSASGGVLPEQQEEQPQRESDPSVRPKSKPHKSRRSKQKVSKKAALRESAERAAEQPMAVVPSSSSVRVDEEDTEQLWADALNLGNLFEALDTLTADQFSDEELGFAADFYRLGREKIDARVEDYAKRMEKHAHTVLQELNRSALMIEKAAYAQGVKRHTYREAAQRITQKSVESSMTWTEKEGGEVLDYGLRELKPEDVLDEGLRPASEDRPRFRGYQCAMLLLFKTLVVECHEIRSREFFARAQYLTRHITVVCGVQAPKLEKYFESVGNYVKRTREGSKLGILKDKPTGEINADYLKRFQGSLAPIQEFCQQALGAFYHISSTLAEISNRLPELTAHDWHRLISETTDERNLLASLNVDDQKKAFESLERVRDQIVRSGADTSTASSR